jgi:hypothetical protein
MDYFSGNAGKPEETTTSAPSSSVLPTEEADEPAIEVQDTKEAEPEQEPQKPAGLNAGHIILICLGGAFLCAAVILVILFLRKKKKDTDKQ